MNHLNKLISKDLVIGLPKLKFDRDHICEACQKGKQVKSSFKTKNVVSSLTPFELLHMDLFGPSRTMSLGGNYYALVIVDDFLGTLGLYCSWNQRVMPLLHSKS